jgi:DNA-binding XRE family transcriptional regulator
VATQSFLLLYKKTERGKFNMSIFVTFYAIVMVIIMIAFIGLFVLIVRALLKYIKSKDVRQEKSAMRKSLGEALKEHRTRSKMTQEFVAEMIGVSRQAVSKWESGTSDPSTSNLFAIAKLYGISVEELLKEVE